MNTKWAVQLALLFASIATFSTLIAALSSCAIFSSRVLAIVYGSIMILFFIINAYFIYKSYKIANAQSYLIMAIILNLLLLGGCITSFARAQILYSLLSSGIRFVYTAFIIIGLEAEISIVSPLIISKFFGGQYPVIPEVILSDKTFLLMISSITNISCGLFSALLIGLGHSSLENEDHILKSNCIHSVLSSLLSAFVGSFIGILAEFRAEAFGFTPS